MTIDLPPDEARMILGLLMTPDVRRRVQLAQRLAVALELESRPGKPVATEPATGEQP